VITGIFGNIMAPSLIKLMRISDPIAVGVGIGTCSHAVGTSKAIELGEVEGAMSGIALSMSGIITVVLAMVFF
jgi:putative effector of murein hydrolase